jgi:hypothetical protein
MILAVENLIRERDRLNSGTAAFWVLNPSEEVSDNRARHFPSSRLWGPLSDEGTAIWTVMVAPYSSTAETEPNSSPGRVT